jgi:CheY-like chemotaxis protein
VFTVKLPLLHAVPPRAVSSEPETPATQTANGAVAKPLKDVRVLLVEDDADTREALRLLLKSHGAETIAVESCDQAMDTFAVRPPHVLISDIGMPAADGYELVTRVRALPKERGGHVPAIALTAYAGADDARQAIRSGFQAHVPKPFDSRDLVKTIETLVHGVAD